MTIQQLNDELANRLGRNPKGEGHYRWMYSEDWLHLMRTPRSEEVTLPSGVIALQPVYEHRKMMIDSEDTWVLAHWHAPSSEAQWEMENPRLLWPRDGYYAPTNIVLGQGQKPTPTDNEKIVIIIKQQARKTMADLVAESEALEERKDKRYRDYVSDVIDNEVSAFCNIPGTRSSHVQFSYDPRSSGDKEANATA